MKHTDDTPTSTWVEGSDRLSDAVLIAVCAPAVAALSVAGWWRRRAEARCAAWQERGLAADHRRRYGPRHNVTTEANSCSR